MAQSNGLNHRLQKKQKLKFDPIENMHLWVMWRTAVNEKLIKETKKTRTGSTDPDYMSKVFTTVPLARYIGLSAQHKGSQPYEGPLRPQGWYNQDGFQTRQLVYFGLPRPRLVHPGPADFGVLPDY